MLDIQNLQAGVGDKYKVINVYVIVTIELARWGVTCP